MAFSIKAARENKQMFNRSMELWQSSGYNPENTPRGGMGAHIDFLEPYLDSVMEKMMVEFSDIPRTRIMSQVMRAKGRIYSEWVRNRGNR